MGRKKPKDPETESASASASASGQADIFTTLFGAGDDGAPAIFSDNNPFRRKNQEAGVGFEASESISHGESEKNPEDGEVMKRKRSKEKKASGLVGEEGAPETPLEGKKSKKKKLQETPNLENPNLGHEVNVASEKGNDDAPKLVLGLDSNDWMKNSKGKKMDGKKRKRDELESKYEAKKYGVKEIEGDDGGKVVGEKRKTVDNPVEMLVSNEGFDDESKLLRTVFVGNLPLKIKKKVLIKEFTQFGEVESVRIRSVPILDTKRPRKGAILTKQIHDKADSVNAYIVFKTEESAQASLSHNMAVVEGHHIRVDRACPPRKKLKGESVTVYDHTRTVFVGNLPFDVKDEEVYKLFCGINNRESNVEAIRIIRDPNYGIGKGIAYVLFKTKEAANLVVKKRNLKLGDRELRLSHAKPESTPTKRKDSPSASESKSPAKKRAIDSRTPDFNKVNSTASMSYQGLRAGKPGVQKKFHSKGSTPAQFESRSPGGAKPKERKDKRPSVAARKAKAALGGSASKQGGMKRKMDSRTPERSQQKKKLRKHT